MTKPGEVLGGSVGFLLSKLGFLTATRFSSALEPLGIMPQHFALMRIVHESEARSQQALGEALAIPPSRMVGLVDDLEDRGLLERRQGRPDRRVKTVHLTAAGRRAYQRALAVATDWENELCAGLEPEEREQLLELLQRLASGRDLPVGVHPALVQPD